MTSTSSLIHEPTAQAGKGPKEGMHQPVDSTHELRIVLVGARGTGRTSSANTLLGRPAFDTKALAKENLLQQGHVFGRTVSVVDTVGLYWTHDQATQRVRDEIGRGVDLCPPGPHAFLLVVPLDGFTLQDRADVEDILSIFGERVWDHTIVLFTFGDWLKDRTIGQYLDKVGPDLREVVDKCGGRYHVFSNIGGSDSRQVTELLDKVEELVMENGGHFISNEQAYQEMRERLLWLERKLTKRYEEAWRKREEELRQRTETTTEVGKLPLRRRDSKHIDTPNMSELRVMMLGRTGAGKSATGNAILGENEFPSEASSCSVTRCSQKGERHVSGRRVMVVDTPDWLSGALSQDNIEQDVGLCLALSSPGPHVFLLVMPVGRSSGEEMKLVEILQHVFGTEAVEWAMVLFTHTERLKGQKIKEFVQRGSDSLRQLVEKCGNRYHVFSSDISTDGTQVTLLLEKVEALVAGHGGHSYSSEAYQRIESQIRRRQKEIMGERQEEIQAEVNQLREKHQEEVWGSAQREKVNIQEREGRVQTLITQTQGLREGLRDDKTNAKKRAELEGELIRAQEQIEDLEREKEGMRTEQERVSREMEEKLTEKTEEFRRRMEAASREEAEQCKEVLCYTREVAIKSMTALKVPSHRKEIKEREELQRLYEEKAQETERYRELIQTINTMTACRSATTPRQKEHHKEQKS